MIAQSPRKFRVLLVATAATLHSFDQRQASAALNPVTLNSTGTSAANPWGSLLWSDGSLDNPGSSAAYNNASSGSTTASANAYTVGSGLTLYAPTQTTTTTSTFFGGSLTLNGATLVLPGSSSGTFTGTFNFSNSGLFLNGSTLSLTAVNATETKTLTGAITFSGSNIVSYTGGSFSELENITGLISGSAGTTTAFTYANGSTKTVTINNANDAYSGAIVLGTTSGASSFNLTTSLGAVSSYTIGSNWTLTNGTGAAINAGTVYNISSGGALAAAGPSGYGNAGAWISSGQISTASAGSLAITASDGSSTLNLASYPSLYLGSTGAFTFSGSLTPGSNGYLLGGGAGTLTMGTLLADTGGPTPLTIKGAVALTQSNTFGGNTTITSGSVLLTDTLALQNSTVTSALATKVITFGNNGTGTIDAFTLGGIAGADPIVLQDNSSSPNPVTLTIGNNNAAAVYTGNLNGSGGLVKIGTGLQSLGGTGAYAGTTTINAGTLQFVKQVGLYNNTSGSWTANNITVAGGATLAVNAGGTGQFTAASVSTLLSGLSALSGGFLGGSSFGIDTTNAGGTFTYPTPIVNPNSGSNSMGLSKLGNGLLTLTASNTYTGPTLVNAGTLALDASGSNTGAISASAVTVNGGATLLVRGNTSTGAVSLAGGAGSATQGVLDLRDGTINTLTVNGNLAFGTGSNGSVLELDFGSSAGSNDSINVVGSVTENGTTAINMNALGSLSLGSYTLITDTGGGLAGGTGFSIGTHPVGNSYSLASSTADQLILTVSNGNPTPTIAYWTGLASASADSSNNWGYMSGSATNFSNVYSGTTDAGQVPGSITNVYFTAANATPVSGVLSTQLDNFYSINSLTFDTSPAPSITNVGINTNGFNLTIGTGGLTVASTDTSNATITGSASSLLLGASQTWTNNSSSQSLTVSTGIAGTAAASSTETLTFAGTGNGGMTISGAITDGTAGGNLGLVFSQTGVVQLNGTNTFTGGVIINSGTLRLGNSAALNSTTPNLVIFSPTGTGDLQLNGNTLTTPTLSTYTGQIIEDAGTAPATLNINESSGSNTFGGVLRDGTGGGALSLTVSDASTLNLAGSNAYSGTTTLGAGSTINAMVTGAIPVTSSLAFTGAATLNMSGFGLTVAGLTVAGSTSFTPTISNTTSLTVNATSNSVIGGTASSVTDTLDLSTFGSFNFNGSSSVALILSGSAATGGNGALNLAATSTIKTGTIDVGVAPTILAGGNGYSSTGILALGTTNIIDANNIVVGNHPGGTSSGTITFQSGLTSPTLTLAGFAGGSSTVNMIVGESSGSDYSTTTGTVDFSGGTVNASFGTLSIGIHAYNNANFAETGTGTFTMGAGNVTASTIILGQTIPGGINAGKATSSGNGTFNLGTSSVSGGTLQVGTLTMGDQERESTNTSAVTSTFNFNGGLLEAAIIQPGATQSTGAGADTRTFNWNAGTIQNFNPTTGLSITIPTITIAGGGNQTFDITSGQTGTVSSNMSGGAIIKADLGTLTLSGSNTFTGGTNVSGGKLVLASATAFPTATALTIASGASVTVANHGSNTVYVPTTNALTNNGTIDITNNAIDIQNGSISGIFPQIQNAYNGGTWNGTSSSSGVITSSMAAADTTHLTAVGFATNLNSFENQSVNNTDVVLKYTYYGDADLDGQVTSADYTLIDAGYLSAGTLTGWQNGDFNYDGVVNGSDYTLIDNAFNTQGAQLLSQIASPTAQLVGGTSAVPEPASVALLGIGALGLLGRRNRRRI